MWGAAGPGVRSRTVLERMSVMTEATIGANKAKTAKDITSPFGVPNYEIDRKSVV